tara:strand:+ start:1904 stop:3031 length:1128 start_codon:yes stop_codon:yes gene_type:complete
MKKNNLYIGILTGTSMDSIDCGIFKFDNEQYKIISFHENHYPKDIKSKIINNYKSLKENYKKNPLNKEIALIYSDIINSVISKEKINKNDINAIGMHGQTISHGLFNNENISIQLGCPITLAEMTKIKVVSAFRQNDINNGGEGAPLAPLFHDYVFKNNKKRVIVNIGGISNISFLSNNNNNLFGFDSGPGNTLIDSWIKKKYNLEYDVDGKISAENKCSDELLKIFINDKYFNKNSPKSTSTEYFNQKWIDAKIKLSVSNFSDGDVLATLTKLTVISITNSIKDYCPECEEIYICGGGAFNNTIVSQINYEANKIFLNKVIVDTTNKISFPPKEVETGLFAWLAMSRINEQLLDYSNITGSKKPSTLGEIYFPK